MAHSVTIALITSLCCCLAPCFGYSISSCDDNNKVQFEESGDAVLTCTGITHNDMVWRLNHTGGRVSQIGTCFWPSGTCNVIDSDYSVSRPQRASSVVTITENLRIKIAGTVMCAGLSGGTVEDTVSCDVRVVYTSYQLTNCAVKQTTSTSPWTVSGSCDVNKIYATDDQYSCQWFETPQTGAGSRSFSGAMHLVSSFSVEGQTYHKAKCTSALLPMPTTSGVYSYSLKIDPSNGVHSANTVQIQSPEGPPVLLNCPDSMIEGDDDTCTCQASAAEPSASVTWSGSGTTAVNDTATLALNGVPKSLDGHSYTCSQYWGGSRPEHVMATVYTLRVEYPPSSPPQISGNTTRMEGDSLVLSCTVTGGNPPVVTVTFYCGDHVDNEDSLSTENGQTVVTSTFEIDSLTARDYNGSQCMCSANWDPLPTLYQTTATVTILVLASEPPGQSTQDSPPEPATTVSGATSTTGNPNTSSEGDGDADLKLAALVGGIVGGIAAIIIIVLIIVNICLWKRGCEPRYARPATGRQDDDHNYTELDHYQQIGPQEQRTERTEKGTMDQHQYENSDVNPLGSSSKAQYENTGSREEPASSVGHYEIA